MKLSDHSIKLIGNLIAGDIEGYPYRSGPKLVEFFNQFGMNDVYDRSFGTRRIFAQDKIRALNGTKKLIELIEKFLDPRSFYNSEKKVNDAISLLNEYLIYDGYEVVENGIFFKVVVHKQKKDKK